jgi:hypothetical protein
MSVCAPCRSRLLATACSALDVLRDPGVTRDEHRIAIDVLSEALTLLRRDIDWLG